MLFWVIFLLNERRVRSILADAHNNLHEWIMPLQCYCPLSTFNGHGTHGKYLVNNADMTMWMRYW